MPMSVTIALGRNPSMRANQPTDFTVTVSNSDSSAAVLTSLAISEDTKMGANIAQPVWQSAGQAAGSPSQPSIAASGSASYAFQVSAAVPSTPGPNPANAPGGASPSPNAFPASQQLTLRATGQTSAGLFTTTLTVPVLSAVAPVPLPDVGALFFAQGGNSNLLAVMAG